MIPTSFVYNLRKEELIKYLEEFKLDTTGTVDELRKRFSQFIGEHGGKHEDKLKTLMERHSRNHSRSPSPRPVAPDSKIPVPTTQYTQTSTSTTLTYSEEPITRLGSTQTRNSISIDTPLLPVNYSTIGNSMYTSYLPISSQVPLNMMGIPTLFTTPSYSNHTMTTANYPPVQTQLVNTSYLYPQYGQSLPLRNTTNETPVTPDPESALLMDKIRKWSIKYTGSKDALAFIERVEELSAAYGVELDKIPPLMSELLQEKALAWFRYSKKLWPSWIHFKREFLNFFLPPRYLEQLDDKIRQRQQQPKEIFEDYVVGMMDLMRYSDYSEAMKLERIYRNSRQAFQLHIKRREFQNLDELIELAGDFELIEAMGQSYKTSGKQPPTRQPTEHNRQMITEVTPSSKIDPRQACRRCGQNGHFARRCKNEQVIFCWECGIRGKRTIECCRKPPENLAGTQPQGQ